MPFRQHPNLQLNSITTQAGCDVKIYVSDDGSDDRTIDILKKAKANGAVEEIFIGPSLGFAKNFHFLAHKIPLHFDYYAFADQDDIWKPYKLEIALKNLDNIGQKRCALFCSRSEYVDANENYLGLSNLFKTRPSVLNSLVQNIAGGNTMVFNKPSLQLFRNIPLDVEMVAHDWTMYQICIASGGFVKFLPLPLIKYRQHEANAIGSNVMFVAKCNRFLKFLNGDFKKWTDINLAVLQILENKLEHRNFELIAEFKVMRKQYFFSRFLRCN